MNQISIDDNGDYIASCSDDGRVSTMNIFGDVVVVDEILVRKNQINILEINLC